MYVYEKETVAALTKINVNTFGSSEAQNNSLTVLNAALSDNTGGLYI